MANALIYGKSGSGKTVNSTRVIAPNRGKNLLLCSDNSYHLLETKFKRNNLDIEPVEHWIKNGRTMHNDTCFKEQFDKAVDSKMYDNIIIDNLSDLVELATNEFRLDGTFNDIRQAYQSVYIDLKQLTRRAGQLDCNVLFTAWEEVYERTMPDGTIANCVRPQLPNKIINNVCGLCNVLAYISKSKDEWVYLLQEQPTIMAKDQLADRPWCRPEEVFDV